MSRFVNIARRSVKLGSVSFQVCRPTAVSLYRAESKFFVPSLRSYVTSFRMMSAAGASEVCALSHYAFICQLLGLIVIFCYF